MNRLSIAMFGSLDDEPHPPDRQRRDGMPMKAIPDDNPCQCVESANTTKAAGRAASTPSCVNHPRKSLRLIEDAIEKGRHVSVECNRSTGGQFFSGPNSEIGPRLVQIRSVHRAVLDLPIAKCLIPQRWKGGRVV